MRTDSDGRQLVFAMSALALFALLLREYYLLTARVDNPFVGDARQYASYAYNLVEHGIFSSSAPGSAQLVADAYRGPGYPLLIAIGMALSGTGSADWYYFALHAQALLGAATVALTVALGWRWHRPATGVLAGTLLCLWPTHVTATGALLSEVLLGFLLALSTWLSLSAKRESVGTAFGAAVAWGWSFLVSPVVFFLPFGFATWLWRSGDRRKSAALAGVFLLIFGAWFLRNALLDAPHQAGRATVNFVQGSWPLYHDAWVEFRNGNDPYANQILHSIDSEVALLDANPGKGLRKIWDRISDDPGSYGYWYLQKKPFLLWDWDIRIGSGGLYVVGTVDSPYQVNRNFDAVARGLRWINPAIFWLAVAACAWTAWGHFRTSTSRPGVEALALMFLYFTAVHVVFQAEPRYSIPYRFIELLLAASLVFAALPRRPLGGSTEVQMQIN